MTHAVNMNATVDVVVPSYRYGCYLRQCVQSILDQSHVRVRVFIIDDASPDEFADIGADIARDNNNVTFLRHERNRGHIWTYNEGIEWATARYFLLLSADDYLLPGALACATRMMESSPGISMVFGNALIEYDDGVTEPIYPLRDRGEKAGGRIFGGPDFVRLSGASNLVPTPTAVVRTETQKRIGGYRVGLPHSGDMEMWLRFAAHGSIGFVDRLQAVYRRHAGNMSDLYAVANSLPDLRQRKAAIDSFLLSDERDFGSESTLRRELYDDLGRIAIGRASAAFNTGGARALQQLTEFAVEVSPTAKLSLPWMRLMAKRLIGQRAWNALQSVQEGTRPRSSRRL